MYKLFSVDDHIIEPADVWTSRLPTKYREVGPHVVEADGRQFWVYEDQRAATMGLNAVAGKDPTQWGIDPVRFSDLIPGCYDPAVRAEDLRSDGIVGSVLFPSLPGFGGRVFAQLKDKELADLCVRAYNDFVIDEWCAAAPDLYVPTVICQLWDPQLAAAEIRRCAAKGAKALSFPDNTSPIDLPSLHTDHWDAVFDVLQETGIVCSMHGGASGYIPIPTPDTDFSVVMAVAPGALGCATVGDLIFSSLPRRFPDVKFVMTEFGAGYMPYLLERADFVWHRHRAWAPFGDERPSDVFHRQVYVCAINEEFALKPDALDIIGVDNILWELDYPHSETSWPASQSAAEKVFGGMDKDIVAKITHKTAERIFNFPVAS